jgi:peptide/nickel transport system permease protein
MLKFVAGRVAGSLATIFGVSVISFFLLRVFPGDPVRLTMGHLASQEAVDAQRRAMGLDDPVFVQYIRYIGDFVTGDWGFAYSSGAEVNTLFFRRLPATLELGIYAFALSISAALILALLATYRRRRWVDSIVRGLSFVGLGTPPFWLALLLLFVFSQQVRWMPGPEGRLGAATTAPPTVTHLYTVDALLAGQFGTFLDAIRHLALPVATLAFASFALLVRLLRASLLEVSREPFMLVVRGKGRGRWSAFTRHALPNAVLPTLTVSGMVLAELLAGSVLIEKVFNWPGIGSLAIDSIGRQEFAVVQAFILLSACAYVVVNLVIDMLYGVIDPRARVRTGVKP